MVVVFVEVAAGAATADPSRSNAISSGDGWLRYSPDTIDRAVGEDAC